MKRTLRLTSPLMRGADVEYARRKLRSNVFKTKFLGELEPRRAWNETCAAATRRAKFELGYPAKQVNGAFGTVLERYLAGADPLPAAYVTRRKKRAATPDIGAAALAEAEKWIGTKETPAGSNIALPFTDWYGWHGWGAPWCAVFVSWCLDKAGFPYVSPGDARWAYCPYFLRDARERRNGLKVVGWADVKPGTIVLFDWDNDGVADHIGFVKKKLAGTSFESVEGNTSPDNFSNGGKVVHYGSGGVQARNASDVIAFVQAGS